MDHLTAGGLDNPAHNVDGRIMAIKQAGRGYNANFIFGFVGLNRSVPGENTGFALFFSTEAVSALIKDVFRAPKLRRR